MKKRILSVVLAFVMIFSLLPVTVFATEVVDSGYCGGDKTAEYDSESGNYKNLTWTLDSNGLLTISGTGVMKNYYSSDEEIVGKGYQAPWFGKQSITNVKINDGVESVGRFAFQYCPNITNVVIGNSVKSIGEAAFADLSDRNSSKLTHVKLGNSVTSIGNKAFYNCVSLSDVIMGINLSTIGCNAFSGCKSLTTISLPDSLTYIGSHAFEHCTSLITVTFGGGLMTIGEYAFSCCTSLNEVLIPASVTSIGYRAFSQCYKMNRILVDIGNSYYSSDSYGILFNKDKTKLICCPGGYDGDYIIPEGVLCVDELAFYHCSNLTGVIISDSVKNISQSAFSCCENLTSVTLGKCVDTIGGSAFLSCETLSEVNIPDSTTSIESYAFSGCKELQRLTIGNSVKKIGYNAFSYCKCLITVEIPDSVTSIGDRAFNSCKSLTSVTIGNSVTSIGDSAFNGCSSLTSVTIPNSVTSISGYAFYHCSSLMDVYYSGSETQWKAISIGSYNECLTNATIHYNSANPGIELNGDPNTAYFVPLKAGTITRNYQGDYFFPVLVVDGTGEPITDTKIHYSSCSTSTQTPETTDENGVAVLRVYGSEADPGAYIIKTDPHYGIGNQSLKVELLSTPLVYSQEYKGILTEELGGTLLKAFAAAFSNESEISAEFSYIGDDCTLMLSSKGTTGAISGAEIPLTSETLLNVKIDGGTTNQSSSTSGIIQIEHFDESNETQSAAVGYFILSAMFPENSTTSMKLRKAFCQQALFNEAALYQSREDELEIEAAKGTSLSVKLGDLSYELNASDTNQKYTLTEKYDGIKDETEYSSKIQVESGRVISGTWIPGLGIDSSIYGTNLNKQSTEIAVIKDGSNNVQSVSLESADEDYDDVIGTSESTSASMKVLFTGKNAEELLKNDTIAQIASGNGALFTENDGVNSLGNAYRAMNELQTPADIITNETKKSSFKYGINIGLDAAAKFGISFAGSKSTEYQVGTGVLYKGKAYTTTDGADTSGGLNTDKHSFGDVLEIASKGVYEFIKGMVISSVQDAVSGVKNKAAEVAGDMKEWFISLTTIQNSTAKLFAAPRNVTTNDAYATAIINGEAVRIKVLSDPYILGVFTDETCEATVDAAELASHPVSISIAYENVDGLDTLKLYRYDNDLQVYVPVQGSSIDAGGQKVSAKVTTSGEFIIATSEHEHVYAETVTTPTCAEKGFTTHTCSCDDSYIDSYVDALGHSYANGVCTRCGEKDPNYKPAEYPFTDVDVAGKHAPFADAILWAANEGITTGYGNGIFKPDANCTRAQVVTFLWRAAGEPAPKSAKNPFVDVSAKQANGKDNPYYTAILWAVGEGITLGVDSTHFAPDATVTRAQFVTFLWRYEGKPAAKPGVTLTDLGTVTNADFKSAILWAAGEGITTGYADGSFRPNAVCTRAHVVTFIYRDMT